MHDERISLKRPWLAGILAFLLPGAGHLYQGRFFKAAVFGGCILGLFLTGMAMAEWQAVQPPTQEDVENRRLTALLKYGAQLGVGLPALGGLVQRQRAFSEDNTRVVEIDHPFSSLFVGTAEFRDAVGVHQGSLSGQLTLKPAQGQFGGKTITGEFQGTFADDEGSRPVTWQLSNEVVLDQPVAASKQRGVVGGILDPQAGRQDRIGYIRGTIPRSFWNWFEVPMTEAEEQELHDRLGKFHELAMVLTWVAGLLNVLAIWDAVEGPAYGYSDEEKNEGPTPAAA